MPPTLQKDGELRMVRLLITYFGAFEGVSLNPTQRIAENVKAQLGSDQLEIVLRELPVTFAGSSRELAAVLKEVEPDVVISTGVAVGRDSVSLERIAVNLDDARIIDNDGVKLVDQPIQESGPAAYFSALPTRSILQVCQQEKLPVSLSYTAGTYVCNHVFYELMHALAGSEIPAGFIHIPAIAWEEEDQLRAHADAGGIEDTEIPRCSEAEVTRALCLAIAETLAMRG